MLKALALASVFISGEENIQSAILNPAIHPVKFASVQVGEKTTEFNPNILSI